MSEQYRVRLTLVDFDKRLNPLVVTTEPLEKEEAHLELKKLVRILATTAVGGWVAWQGVGFRQEEAFFPKIIKAT